jgi:DNA-binding phage protein
VEFSIDPQAIRAIRDPLERNQAYLRALEEARRLQADLTTGRGLAIYELYARDGASKAARLLGISRAGLYKIIAEHAPPEVKEARRKALAGVVEAVVTAAAMAQQQSTERRALEQARATTASKGGVK